MKEDFEKIEEGFIAMLDTDNLVVQFIVTELIEQFRAKRDFVLQHGIGETE
jgi:hypothetical protein